MFGMGVGELLIFGVIAVLLFGKRLPEVARSFGQSYHQFRRGLQDVQSEMDRVIHAPPPPRQYLPYGDEKTEQEDAAQHEAGD